MKQPALGLTATALVVAVSLVIVRLLGPDLFMGWASYAVMGAIPFMIVVGAYWHGEEPAPIARLSQPARGLAYLAVATAVAAVVAIVHWQTRGAGLPGPVPLAVMTIITSVVTTFFVVIVWGGRPFSLLGSRLVSGVAVLMGVYAINALIFQLMNFGFVSGAPWYAAAHDPRGPIDAWTVVVVMVTSLAVMFCFLLLDLWPLTRSTALAAHPLALSAVWTVACVAVGATLFWLGTSVAGLPAPVFLVRVPIPFLFGAIIVLNMLGGSLFKTLTQPLKGLAGAMTAAVLGNALALAYAALMPVLSGALPSGPAGDFAAELWLANSLLAITFPLLAAYGDFFGLWPLAGRPADHADAPA